MLGVRGYAGTVTEALARQDRSFTETENAVHKTDHAVVGENLVSLHEGAGEQREWAVYGPACLACLAIDETEVDHWLDDLLPLSDGVALG